MSEQALLGSASLLLEKSQTALEMDQVDPDCDDYAQDVARSAFADMLHDTERNELYEEGIKWAIAELRSRGVAEVVVLDIGTGSGLLSMLAARYGADVIYACDGFPPAVEVARKVIEANGFSGRIKLISKMSTDLKIGPALDMERRANLLVAELLDTELIGEGLIRSYRDACSRLLTKDCLMVPQTATVFAQLVDSQFLRAHHTGPVFGLRLSEEMLACMGTASLHDIQLSQLDDKDFAELCQPAQIFHFELKDVDATPSSLSVSLPDGSSKTETLAGDKDPSPCVFMWWQCQMAPGVIMSCAPRWAHPKGRCQPWRDHWMQAVYYPHRKTGSWLRCFRDEFSFWFELSDDPSELRNAPVCTCGAHFSLPRSRLAQLAVSEPLFQTLSAAIAAATEDHVLLICDGGLALPLAIARQFSAKTVYIMDTVKRTSHLTQDLLRLNNIANCLMFDASHTERIELVVADPWMNGSLLPWESLFALNTELDSLKLKKVRRLPETSRLMAIEVDFDNLWRIRAPVVRTVDLDMTDYDLFIQAAMSQCDKDEEPQPLWEYPGIARGLPMLLANDPKPGQTVCMRRSTSSNGVAFWMEFGYGAAGWLSWGPMASPTKDKPIAWNRFVKQAVMLNVSDKKQAFLTL